MSSLTDAGDVDVLRREEEEIDANARLDTFLRRRTVEGVLRNEQRLLLVGAVQLAVFAMLEGAWPNRG